MWYSDEVSFPEFIPKVALHAKYSSNINYFQKSGIATFDFLTDYTSEQLSCQEYIPPYFIYLPATV